MTVAADPREAAPAREDDLEAQLLAQVAALAPAAGQKPLSTPAGTEIPAAEAAGIGPDGGELERLRQLLMGREINDLNTLWRKLNDPDLLARTLSPAVTEALLLRTQSDRKLDAVLKDTIERILHGSVRRNPSELADNLFPVMGPAIRRSITESLRGMLQDFSRLMEMSFSVSGLKWRLAAMRTGRSFSEVLLLNNLEYQVEQVFFVHTQTGTALVHAVHEGIQAKDDSGDQVAAMFTALQRFVSDSFAEGELNDLTFGDVQICVVQGPEAYLASVVRGQTPPTLRQEMLAILELLLVEFAEELENFKGDLEPFEKSRRFLDNLLVSRQKDKGRKLGPLAFLLPALASAIIFGPIIFLGHAGCRSRQAAEAEAALQLGFAALEKRIYDEAVGPGLSPTHIIRGADGVWDLTFLKDEIAEGPEERLAALGLSPEQVRLHYLPFLSLAPELLERRVSLILDGQPETLERQFDWTNGVLILSGRGALGEALAAHDQLRSLPGLKAVLIQNFIDRETGITADLGSDHVLRLWGRASIGWRESFRDRVLSLPGIGRLDMSQLDDDDASRRVRELLAGINGTAIYFPFDRDQPIPENRDLLHRTVEDLVELEKLAASMGLTVSLGIYGYTDLTGQEKRNYELSQARTRTLAALLYERGSAIALSTFGLGPDPAEEAAGKRMAPEGRRAAAQASRRIELKARLDRPRVSITE